MRGARELEIVFLGDLERENPEAQPMKAKGMRGALKQYQR
jgi:hypothetical protein